MCQQADFMINKFVKGSENCLHLNVYTPRVSNSMSQSHIHIFSCIISTNIFQVPRKIDTPKPVMVSIHGGGFCRGSGTRRAYSADYLITRDVILVSINYRLLVLGSVYNDYSSTTWIRYAREIDSPIHETLFEITFLFVKNDEGLPTRV